MIYTVGYKQKWEKDGCYRLRLDIIVEDKNGQLIIYDWNHSSFKYTTRIDGRRYGYNYLYGEIELANMDLERAYIYIDKSNTKKKLQVWCSDVSMVNRLEELYS